MTRSKKSDPDWRKLNGTEVRNKRMTMRYPRAFAKKNSHNTIRKKLYIYSEYLRIRSSMKEAFPELADYLPKRYYYMILANRLLLSKSYIYSVISYIKRMGLEKEVQTFDFKRELIKEIDYDSGK